MHEHWYLERLGSRGTALAFVSDGQLVTYAELHAEVLRWLERLRQDQISGGDVVVILGDHSPSNFALLLALAIRKCVCVPLTEMPQQVVNIRCDMAGANWLIDTTANDGQQTSKLSPELRSDILDSFKTRQRAGLILFSSGSSGTPKTCLLDLDNLLETTWVERQSFVTLAFLLFDHIGGINTVINILGHGGTVVVATDRSIPVIAGLIERHRVTLLPTSPTFLKMLLMSEALSRYDLSSLQLVTYGTEVMPEPTLRAMHEAFPAVRLKQTYGLSEIGIVPTRSRSDGSLWVEIGGKGVEYKVRDNILFLRAPTAMVAYLNAPSPFDEDGWLNTGDRVEVDGNYLKILGRDSELINIGGEKVHPAEVENVLLDAPNVTDATVFARPSPVTGSVLTATISLKRPEDKGALRKRLGDFCRERLEAHKVPVMFKIADAPMHSTRFKKTREPQT